MRCCTAHPTKFILILKIDLVGNAHPTATAANYEVVFNGDRIGTSAFNQWRKPWFTATGEISAIKLVLGLFTENIDRYFQLLTNHPHKVDILF
ncbi:hypothetical protein [Anabaena azotica]|uniref:Uncharacterized protein n=1 Tax=Anabaena azotica FACHB-119 TaxID=947527 RepID=A0ABR8D5K8_9NOST|nr:hypothetical protein [Anabaena azotica]MBD2502439.1 hypothetical protein [Anabaena azotica FACHB-119]